MVWISPPPSMSGFETRSVEPDGSGALQGQTAVVEKTSDLTIERQKIWHARIMQCPNTLMRRIESQSIHAAVHDGRSQKHAVDMNNLGIQHRS